MARLGKSLIESARLANPGGTLRMRTHDLYKQQKAQNLLAGLTSKVNPALGGAEKTGLGTANTIAQIVAAATGNAWVIPFLIGGENLLKTKKLSK